MGLNYNHNFPNEMSSEILRPVIFRCKTFIRWDIKNIIDYNRLGSFEILCLINNELGKKRLKNNGKIEEVRMQQRKEDV